MPFNMAQNPHGSSPSVTTVDNSNLGNGYVSDIEFGDDEDHIIVTKSNYGVNLIYVTDDGGSNWSYKEDGCIYPSSITTISEIETEGNGTGVFIHNNYVLIADGKLSIIDISNPSGPFALADKDNPREKAYAFFDERPYGLNVKSNNIFVAKGPEGVCTYENILMTPDEYGIEPVYIVYDISPNNISYQPVNFTNNTGQYLEFNLDIRTQGEDTTGIVGEWLITYDWNCNSETDTSVFNFLSDYTFTNSEGYSGTWRLEGNQIQFVFESGTPITV